MKGRRLGPKSLMLLTKHARTLCFSTWLYWPYVVNRTYREGRGAEEDNAKPETDDVVHTRKGLSDEEIKCCHGALFEEASVRRVSSSIKQRVGVVLLCLEASCLADGGALYNMTCPSSLQLYLRRGQNRTT